MFSPNFDLILNLADLTASGRLALAGSKVVSTTDQRSRLIRNDPGNTRLRFCLPSNTAERIFDDVDVSSATVRTFLGTPDHVPSAGTFVLAPIAAQTAGPLVSGKRYLITDYVALDNFTNVGATANATGNIFPATGTTPTTWTHGSSLQEITTDLAIDATYAEVQAALNATAALTALGGVTVTKPTPGAYRVTFTGTYGARTAIAGPINANMTPLSVVSVSRVQPGTSTLHEVQLIRLMAVPYCAAVISTPLPVAAAVITEIQGATSRVPATKKLTLEPQPYAGTILFTIDGTEYEAPFDAIEALMASLVGPKYKVTHRASNAWEFSGVDAAQEITLTADASHLSVPIGVTGRMPLNTDGMSDAFAATGKTTLRFIYEVSIQWPGEEPQVVYQVTYEVHRDLGNSGTLLPASMVAMLSIGSDAVYAKSITALRGGPFSLESVATTALSVDTLYFILIGGYPQGWILKAGAADGTDPTGQVAPLDYNAGTNNKHWERAGL